MLRNDYITNVIATFEHHKQGIVNAFKTQTDSGKHENLNGKIQSILAKARGFLNFDRFRINVLFYFGKLNSNSTKKLVMLYESSLLEFEAETPTESIQKSLEKKL